MMNKPILEVQNLSKLYKINGTQETYLSFRDSIKSVFKRTPNQEFWALKDINFSVNAGDSVGIIGKNGAGKSTLLKILSRITPPTEGLAISRGRIASLLEVGTGFHGELSGRENVYMNGSILGMSRSEINRNFDAIVDFSGVEKFIDTPLKHYSSGMQLRLAFAVAAFLENEILIIDEVLAVGDSEFQKKCLGKMKEVSTSGRTVLFVSHNIAAVKSLCNKGIVLNSGNLLFDGDIQDAVHHYQSNLTAQSDQKQFFENLGNDNISLRYIEVKAIDGNDVRVSAEILVEIGFKNYLRNINLDCTVELRNNEETIVYHTGALISTNQDAKVGEYVVKYSMPGYYLNAGRYSFHLIFGKNQREALFMADYCYFFDVENDVSLGNNSSIFPGVLRPNFDFEVTHHAK